MMKAMGEIYQLVSHQQGGEGGGGGEDSWTLSTAFYKGATFSSAGFKQEAEEAHSRPFGLRLQE